MSHSDELVNIITNERIRVPNPEFERPIEYPFEHFQRNPGKPTIIIRLSTNSNLDLSRSWAYGFMTGAKVGSHVLVEYLYHLFLTLEETLTTPWETYGVKIDSGKITPLSLLKVILENTDRKVILDNPVQLGEECDKFLLIQVLGMYRYSRSHPKQQEMIAKKSETVAAPYYPGKGLSTGFEASTSNTILLTDNSEIEMLTSAFDMFTEKFQSNEHSRARFGSIITRYLGCSAFSDLIYMAKTIGGEKAPDAMKWFFVPSLSIEANRMLVKSQDEFMVPHSYFPYMIGFKLSVRSPYSAASNPTIHLLAHMVGCLFGIPRSFNAVMVDYTALVHISVNAAIVYVANKHMVNLRTQFMGVKEAEKYQARQKRKEMHQQQGGSSGKAMHEVVAKSPIQWLTYYQDRNYKFDTVDIKELQNAIDGILEPRERTVGEWMKSSFMRFIKTNESQN